MMVLQFFLVVEFRFAEQKKLMFPQKDKLTIKPYFLVEFFLFIVRFAK